MTFKQVTILLTSLFFIVISQASKDTLLEPLYGLEINDSKLRIKVKSTGCTTADSFSLRWTPDKQLTIIRIKPDNCRRMPTKKWLEFQLKQSIEHFTLTNSLTSK